LNYKCERDDNPENILPTNKRLLDPTLDARGAEAGALVDALGTLARGQERAIGRGFPDLCDLLARARRWSASCWNDQKPIDNAVAGKSLSN
jgi:hypothetical protein